MRTFDNGLSFIWNPLSTAVVMASISLLICVNSIPMLGRLRGRGPLGLFVCRRPAPGSRCYRCGGFGLVRCRLCRGEGIVFFQNKLRHYSYCPRCCGTRMGKCERCRGTGLRVVLRRNAPWWIGGRPNFPAMVNSFSRWRLSRTKKRREELP